MTKIVATEERTLRVRSPLKDVYQFFNDPGLIKEETADVERFELLEGNRAHWILTEKVEKGIRYLADYTVEYHGNGTDHVTWRTIDGNLDTQGEVILRQLDAPNTEIRFREMLAPDLPITNLMAKLFKPIVAREVRKDIGKFLDRVEHRFGRAEG
ncbi:hypothetical protein JRI60_07510 [Archangium violaceum]|uniref:hypothetical protein n=1 Tax=Archangium violaceum TaxID=83451 RepID=UPI001950E977|nr:hypothetical protein [Archangium violaceum]QRN98868.1 hypothetical protein JRI60_07510 [Archangium violaceum]